MQSPTRHDDLDELRRRKIAVPAVFRRGAWVSLALGQHSSDIGPRGTQLLLWLPVRDGGGGDGGGAPAPSWAEVEAVIGERGAVTSRSVPAAAAALWQGNPDLEPTAAGEHWAVHGTEYPSGSAVFGNIFWKHGWVLGTRGGLLVSLVNA
jgi:hypothetical protein